MKKTLKRIICLLVACMMLLQSSSIVLAKIASHEEGTRGSFKILHVRSSNILDGSGTMTLGYRSDGKNIYRIYNNANNSEDFDNTILCLDRSGRFPFEEDAGGTQNAGNYTSLGEATADKLHEAKASIDAEGARRIQWLIRNAILPEDTDELEKQEIAKAFDSIIKSSATTVNPVRVEDIRSIMTEDDLVIAFQLALWKITNNYTAGNISGTADGIHFDSLTGNSRFSYKGLKGDYIHILYAYYLNHWDDDIEGAGTNPVVSLPENDGEEQSFTATKPYIYVGPFKIDEATNFYSVDISFKDSNDEELQNVFYRLTDKSDGTGLVLAPNKESLNGKEFYVQLRANTQVKKITVTATPTIQTGNSKGYVWTSGKAGDQPLLTIVREEETPDPSFKTIIINVTPPEKEYDAALRKNIIAYWETFTDIWGENQRIVNLEDIGESRNPIVEKTVDQKDKNINKYGYYHRKDPVKTEVGKIIEYKITVYNEGTYPLNVTEITDNLPPEGLRLPQNNPDNVLEQTAYEFNQQQGWTYNASTNTISTSKDSSIVLNSRESGLTCQREVTICLVVTPEAEGKIITNIAEITNYQTDELGYEDIDSGCNLENESGEKVDLPDSESDWEMYNGSSLNRDFRIVSGDYWYKGQEDDDDFEKIEVPGEIDLALRKSITEVNGAEVNPTREKEPNTTPLKSGQNTSTFTDIKTPPVDVKVGDKVKFNIRVFNEGNQDGYAKEITDYIPEGLGYLPDYTANKAKWELESVSDETKLGQVENALANFSQSEFANGVDIENARVIKGKSTIKSTALGNEKISNFAKTEELDIHSIEVVCVVLDELEPGEIIKNISAITKYADENDTEIDEDRDSVPDEIDVDSYPSNDHIEDDDDFDQLRYVVVPKAYDLALKKFITKIITEDGEEIIPSGDVARKCEVTNTDSLKNRVGLEKATADYDLNKKIISIKNHDRIIYTIRLFNEGRLDAKVTELFDTIPEGLEFIPASESEINRNNGWNNYSSTGNGWTNGIMTEILNNETIPAFDNSQANGQNKEKGLSYRDVQVEFRVNLDNLDENTINTIYSQGIKNIAEIMDDDGDDNDSTPNNKIESEDDEDYDIVIPPEPERFDLALKKFIISINDGETVPNRFISANSENLAIERSKDATYTMNKDVVKVKSGKRVVYKIRVFNEGLIDGQVKELRDTLPQGLQFIEPEDSTINATYKWHMENGQVYTDYLKDTTLKAYDANDRRTSESDKIIDGISYDEVLIELMVTSKDPSKVIKNEAEITSDHNDKDKPDDDSTPKNDDPEEDDQDFDNIVPAVYDLALKKSIKTVTSADNKVKELPLDQRRSIEVTNTDALINRGLKADATYKLNKTPVMVAENDRVVYTIRVFNEGEEDAIVKELIDTVPDGVELAEYEESSSGEYISGSRVNQKYHWKKRSPEVNGKLTGVVTDYLKNTVIPAFDPSQANGENKEKGLSYRDVEIEFIVTLSFQGDDNEGNSFVTKYNKALKDGITNFAEIKEDDGDDTDSEPDDNTMSEDDEDFDVILPTKFDLALAKFITQVDEKKITGREPKIILTPQNESITTPTDPVIVVNGQTVIYTIRIYNQGSINGYAEEITDDLPKGITFLPDHATNKKYRWKMIDSSGNTTTDIKKAVKITTDYLSKDNETKAGDNLLKAFDPEKPVNDTNPDYRDVQVAFKVTKDDPTVEPKVIINTAEISEDADEDGNPVEDVDSTPGDGVPEQDDIDKEYIKLNYFDLSLLKYISEVVVTEDGKERTISTNYNGLENPEPIVKIELDKKKLAKTDIKYIYTIKITNEGEIEGYAKEITDRIPDGLAFNEEDNKAYNWKVKENGIVTTDYLKDTLLKPGQSADVKIVLRWINKDNNYGLKVNVAEISIDQNEYGVKDIDSTPNNNIDGEDDQDYALSILSVNTGSRQIYLTLIISVAALVGTGLYLIKRYVI